MPLLFWFYYDFVNDICMRSLWTDQGVWLDENNMDDKLFHSAQGECNDTGIIIIHL